MKNIFGKLTKLANVLYKLGQKKESIYVILLRSSFFKSAVTLYHGGLVENKDSIQHSGLIPQVGPWVEEVLSGATDQDIDFDEHGLVFAADKHRFDMAVYAMLWHIANKLGKSANNITPEEIIKYGLLVIIKEGESSFVKRPKDDMQWYKMQEEISYDTGNPLWAVEPEDWFSTEGSDADILLTGNKLLSYITRRGAYPLKGSMTAGYDKWLRQEYIKQKKKDPQQHLFPESTEDLQKRLSDMSESEIKKELDAIKASIKCTSAYDTPFLKQLDDSGRYDIELDPDNTIEHLETYRYKPKGIEHWNEDSRHLTDPNSGKTFKSRPIRWDPEITDVTTIEDEWGKDFKDQLKEGWLDKLPQNPNLIYRGMSWEEYQFILKTNNIQSLGDYNLGDEQIGLTYFSTDPNSAAYYAHSFAPTQYKATPEKPAYVVAVPKRDGVPVAGTGEHEVGVRGPIPANEVVEVWEGMPYYMTAGGSLDIINDWGGRREGSRVSPLISVAWRKIIPSLKTKASILKTFNKHEIEDEDLLESKSTETSSKTILERAIEYFGLTYSARAAGYILPDGRLLDFSEKTGERISDHREVGFLVEEYGPFEYESDAMDRFMKETGCIRLGVYNRYMQIDAQTVPTEKQMKTIQSIIKRYNIEGASVIKPGRISDEEIDFPTANQIFKILTSN